MQTEESVHHIRRTVIDPNQIRSFDSEDDFCGLSVDLLVEVGSYACVAGNLYPIDSPGWDRDQAVVGGHIVRLYKLISALLDQTCQRRRETAFVLMRLAFECVINVRYLIKHASPELFRSFRETSLKHEYRLLKDIEDRIRARGGVALAIEERMRRSIQRSFRLSGAKVGDEPPSTDRHWGGKSLFERAKDLNLEYVYLVAFGGGSHNVHGNWEDIQEYHLEEVADGYFKAEFEWHQSTSQPLNALGLYAADAIIDYLNWISGDEASDLELNLRDMQKRIQLLVTWHEEFVSRQCVT